MKAALIHANRQKDKHEANWPFCDCAKAHKNHMWQTKCMTYKATFRLRWIKGVQKQSMLFRQQLVDLKDVCTCQLHVILSPQTTWSTIDSESLVNSERNFSAPFECTSVPLIFPNSATLFLLQVLMETVQSEATIKCAVCTINCTNAQKPVYMPMGFILNRKSYVSSTWVFDLKKSVLKLLGRTVYFEENKKWKSRYVKLKIDLNIFPIKGVISFFKNKYTYIYDFVVLHEQR
jgi:hypothetical protein